MPAHRCSRLCRHIATQNCASPLQNGALRNHTVPVQDMTQPHHTPPLRCSAPRYLRLTSPSITSPIPHLTSLRRTTLCQHAASHRLTVPRRLRTIPHLCLHITPPDCTKRHPGLRSTPLNIADTELGGTAPCRYATLLNSTLPLLNTTSLDDTLPAPNYAEPCLCVTLHYVAMPTQDATLPCLRVTQLRFTYA